MPKTTDILSFSIQHSDGEYVILVGEPIAKNIASLIKGTQALIVTDENVALHYLAAIQNQLKQKGELAYYALRNGKEIDFVLDKKIAIEVKESPTEDDLGDLRTISQRAGLKKYRLIGRNRSPKFSNYFWGGSIL